jgi:exopolysaccharide/PEP-CTERM locus tyrosine autokinase
MKDRSSLKSPGSLLERAADVYDFGAAIRVPVLPERKRPRRTAQAKPVRDPRRVQEAPAMDAEKPISPPPLPKAVPIATPAASAIEDPYYELLPSGRYGEIDRESLREAGFILPDGPVSGLAEEFRIIKRQLLRGVSGDTGIAADKRQTILVCSAQSDEGKTFSAVNLALSLAGEKDREVLLVDGDSVKPEILSILGLEAGPGFVDAIADPTINPENLVIQTDIEGLSVLPAGRPENDVTELLASERTREVLAGLTRRRPKRIMIFDSPPALMASPASVLATHVGQVMMVVRADQTTEADLREAIALLSGCNHVGLVLNGAGAAATGRRFGSYYGYGE